MPAKATGKMPAKPRPKKPGKKCRAPRRKSSTAELTGATESTRDASTATTAQQEPKTRLRAFGRVPQFCDPADLLSRVNELGATPDELSVKLVGYGPTATVDNSAVFWSADFTIPATEFRDRVLPTGWPCTYRHAPRELAAGEHDGWSESLC